MSAENLSAVAGAVADPTRARMLVALMDGRAWTARELAHGAGVTPSTATSHLNLLVDRGLLRERRQGRHRYVELAGPAVAHALEAVVSLGEQPLPKVHSLREATIDSALRRGRTCYDHLAGSLGVTITQSLIGNGVIDDSFALTAQGRAWIEDTLATSLPAGPRPVTRECLDWTERRVHLGGALGALICSTLHERGWVRGAASSRAVTVTPSGTEALQRVLSIDVASATG
ncbi:MULTISPECIES: winged helix-turn-helix domain-containing protein [unclassified Brevibacterium]|uniref:ArsR/SmtB family transcription factor n=1 Tax=unclassified Brevibacterium TaxID=2614124 RepID=UPI0010FA520B|nr:MULTISPECIES: winged helix-turn-helix domain-containing protein [unclassified Brevibacterium]MCM1013321.1 winged helix-turn-helix domain-containing protein [Brevibacterium sp. XM4083]